MSIQRTDLLGAYGLGILTEADMLVGHFAVGLVAKRVEPTVSIGTSILAAMLADIVCFIFLIAGIEHLSAVPGVKLNRMAGDIPFSHSLVMSAVWAALFAGGYFLWKKGARGAWVLFAAVLSHWLLDVISHRPDMPLAPGVRMVFGFGLWNSLPATFLVEGGFWLIALIAYVRSTRARSPWGSYAFWIFVAPLTLVGMANPVLGIDPDPVKAGITGLVFISLSIAWAFWMNRARPRAT